MKATGSQKSAVGGFSMVELLVVVAIIAVLASFLLPKLSNAKALALSTKCRSNLHQTQLALELYVTDFGKYPLLVNPSGEEWDLVLKGYLRTTQTLYCPVPEKQIGNQPGASWPVQALPMLYGYNSRGVAPEFVVANLGLGEPWQNEEQGQYVQFISQTRLKNPSSMVALSDFTLFNSISPIGNLIGSSIRRPAGFAAPKHLRKANLAFCDGHVETGPESKWHGADSGQRSCWNNDASPHFEFP